MPKFYKRLILGFLSLGLLSGAAVVQAQDLSGVWTGSYECSSQQRRATLTFVDANTAQFDFSPGENARDFSPGSYLMDIWRKEDDFLLTGSEWLEQPQGFSMVDLRLTLADGGLSGVVDFENCGEIRLTKSEAQESPVKAAATLSDSAQFPVYLVGEYHCPQESFGSYLKLDKSPNGDLVAEMTRREYTQAQSSRFYRFVLTAGDRNYSGQESSGTFGGMSLQFADEGEPPELQWLDRRGQIANTCTNPALASAVEPTEYWQQFIDMAGEKNPDIDAVKQAVFQYRTLPVSDFLNVAEQRQFVATRDKRWTELQDAYSKSMPKLLQELAVSNNRERQVAREAVREMSNPGFRHKLDLAQLYTDHLLKNKVAAESLYFSDRDVACERVRDNGRFSSDITNIAWFVGLPASEFDKETIDELVDQIEQCAEADAETAKVAQVALESIDKQVPALIEANGQVVWLKKQADDMLAKPKNLRTLISTDGYVIKDTILRQRRIKDSLYQNYFIAAVQSGRMEAIDKTKAQLSGFFSDEPVDITELRKSFIKCQGQLVDLSDNSPQFLKSLNEVCIDETQSRLSASLADLQDGIGNELTDEEDILELLATGEPNSLIVVANSVGLLSEARDYQRDLLSYKRAAANTLQEKLLEDFRNASGDREVPAVCRDYRIGRYIDEACRTMTREQAIDQEEQRCDAIVQALDIPDTYLNDFLIYGDFVSSKEMRIRELVCELQDQGVDLRISEEASVKGSDRKYGREIFSSAITLVKDDGEGSYWELNNMELKIDNPRLADKTPGRVLECLVSRFGC